MILVDTSVWIDHLRFEDDHLSLLLEERKVFVHPFVTGELAMGSLRNRSLLLDSLGELPQTVIARHEEVLELVQSNQLFGLGLGFIDAHLLTAARLTPDALLWTRDKRLRNAAMKLSLDFTPKVN